MYVYTTIFQKPHARTRARIALYHCKVRMQTIISYWHFLILRMFSQFCYDVLLNKHFTEHNRQIHVVDKIFDRRLFMFDFVKMQNDEAGC